jgi:hypothetical protein
MNHGSRNKTIETGIESERNPVNFPRNLPVPG